MATSYRPDNGEVGEIVGSVMRAHHGDLAEAEVRVGVLMAYPGDDDGEDFVAVKLHRYPCAATIKINSARNRLEGMPDASIVIDAGKWEDDLDDLARRALIDHELTHLEVARDSEGHIKSDDAGRPKLKMRLHDIEIGVFASVMNRYGSKCLDTQMVQTIVDDWGQRLMEWAEVRPKSKSLKSMLGDGATLSVNSREVGTMDELAEKIGPAIRGKKRQPATGAAS